MEISCLHQISPSSSSSSNTISRSSPYYYVPLISSPRIARIRQKQMACSTHKDNRNDVVFSKRRAILLVGISVLPLLQLRSKAFGILPPGVSELRARDQKQEEKGTVEVDDLRKPLISILSGVGFLGSGVLAALYVLAQKEKASMNSAIESTRVKLNEKEEAIVSMEKTYELELQNTKEYLNDQVQKASEEQQKLLDKLSSADSTIAGLGKELLNEKKLVEELKVEIDSLQEDLLKSGEERNKLQGELKQKLESIEVIEEKINLFGQEMRDKEEILQRASAKLAEKEAESNELSFLYQQSQRELLDLTSEIKEIKGGILGKEQELELKNAAVHDLEAQLTSLRGERDELNKKLETLKTDYSNLKSTSEDKAMSDAKLLDEQQKTLQLIQKQLDVASGDVSKNELLVADFTRENNELKKMLHKEVESVNNLKQDLCVILENLDNSRNEASDLKNQLEQSRKLCSDLEAEVLEVRSEFDEARESFERNVEEAKQGTERIAAELTSLKEVIKKTNEEMQIKSLELSSIYETRNNLQKELVDVYKKAETAANDLMEEKKIVATLNQELKILETQIIKDKEARKYLETDLGEATKSLDEMNQTAFVLSKDLELANARISILEDERGVLQRSLAGQKRVSQEARENLEDVHVLVMRLRKDRENLGKKAQELEEDLSAAKGEILRLRAQSNSSKTVVNEPPQQTTDSDSGENTAVSAKRHQPRRKKAVPQHDDS